MTAPKFHTRYWFAADHGGAQPAYDAARRYFDELVARRGGRLHAPTIDTVFDPSPARPMLSTGVVFLSPGHVLLKPTGSLLAWSVRDQTPGATPEKSRILPGGKPGTWPVSAA